VQSAELAAVDWGVTATVIGREDRVSGACVRRHENNHCAKSRGKSTAGGKEFFCGYPNNLWGVIFIWIVERRGAVALGESEFFVAGRQRVP
jgi:hypothetical protein